MMHCYDYESGFEQTSLGGFASKKSGKYEEVRNVITRNHTIAKIHLVIQSNYLFISRLRIIFFYFYLNIPIPYARKIFKIFPYFSKIFPYFFTLTNQLF